MGDSPPVPTVTDPNVVAGNQQNINSQSGVQSQAGSMVNQNTAYGGLNYTQTGTGPGGVPIYSANTTLAPAQQQLLDALNGTKGTAGTQAGNILSNAGYGADPKGVIGDSTKGLTSAAMKQQVAYLDPFFTQQTDQLDTKLKNQGFNPGEPGYDRAMNNLKQSQGQTVTGFESTIEPQMFQQAMQSYLTPASLATALAGFGGPTNPTFQNTPGLNITPANLIGATANAQTANEASYQDQLKQSQAEMSGLFGIPTALLGGWAGSAGGSAALSALMAGI